MLCVIRHVARCDESVMARCVGAVCLFGKRFWSYLCRLLFLSLVYLLFFLPGPALAAVPSAQDRLAGGNISVAGEKPCAASFQAYEALYQYLLDDYLWVGEKNQLPANMMDYAGLRKDPRFRELVFMIEGFPETCLETPAQKVSFYLNAYNILAINKVCKYWPLEKLKSLGSFYKPVWTHPAGKVCNEKVTLRYLEHEVLRKLDEPRIHFALNCASMSCPDLRNEPYRADKLEQQLREQTRLFLLQEGKGLSHRQDHGVVVSAIFKWFEEDFAGLGGSEAFINQYLPEYHGKLRIEGYLKYDWDVNDKLNGLERRRAKNLDRPRTWFN